MANTLEMKKSKSSEKLERIPSPSMPMHDSIASPNPSRMTRRHFVLIVIAMCVTSRQPTAKDGNSLEKAKTKRNLIATLKVQFSSGSGDEVDCAISASVQSGHSRTLLCFSQTWLRCPSPIPRNAKLDQGHSTNALTHAITSLQPSTPEDRYEAIRDKRQGHDEMIRERFLYNTIRNPLVILNYDLV